MNEFVTRYINTATPPCLGMFHDFCANLYSPESMGHIDLPLTTERIEIRRGKTENDFSQAYFEYAQSQLRHRDNLPKAFRQVLSQRGYFAKLKLYLARKPRRHMSVEDRVEMMRLASEIEVIWNGAINETTLKSMEKKFPGYSQIVEDAMPIELSNESKRMRSYLTSEVSKALWLEHRNWKKVESQFEVVRQAYQEIIQKNPRLPPELKADWINRIKSVKLMVPGGDPEVEMYECSRTEENAFYYSKKNYITVCAGDFNAQEMMQTLAHEMAHALDLNRSFIIHEVNSNLGRKLTEMTHAVCKQKQISCDRWGAFRNELSELAVELGDFKPQLSQFNSCLNQSVGEEKEMNPNYVRRVAEEEVQDSISTLAENNVFLRMISQQIPSPDGTKRNNPAYMNPCGYFLWDNLTPPYDDDLTILLFFTAEYQCSQNLPSDTRFRQSIETAKEIQSRITASRIQMEKNFSHRMRLKVDGFASSPAERFADTLGQMAFAQILKNETTVAKRRATYLANTGWLCPKPSLRYSFPSETAIQKQYSSDAHSENNIRQRELLSTDVRDSLQCRLDFEPEECLLEEDE